MANFADIASWRFRKVSYAAGVSVNGRMDRYLLLDAMEHPDDHRNLLIRVAGYSDYFTLLSRDVQQEILSREEHGV